MNEYVIFFAGVFVGIMLLSFTLGVISLVGGKK